MNLLIKPTFIILIYPSSVFAAFVNYDFIAQVTTENSKGVVISGDLIQGSFSYDSSILLTGPTTTNFYTAQQDINLFGINLNAGGETILNEDAFYYNTGVTTNFTGTPTGAHMFSFNTINSTVGWPSKGAIVSFSFIDSTGSVFSNNALPEELSLGDFDTSSLVISNDASSVIKWRINANIISLQPSPVPLPPAILLLSSGLLLIFRFSKKHNII